MAQGGASFEFSTNIGSTAAAIEQGMQRIQRAMRQAQTDLSAGSIGGAGGGPTAGLEQQIIGGVQQRLHTTAVSVDRAMSRALQRMEKDIRSGQAVNVPKEVRNVVRGAEGQLRSIAEDISKGLPAPMRHLAPQLQTQLEQGATQIIREAERMYANIADRLRRTAREVGTRGVSTRGVERIARGDLSGQVAGHRGLMGGLRGAVDLSQYANVQVSDAQQLAAFKGLVGPGGFGLTGKESQAQFEALTDRQRQQKEWQLQEERRNAEQILQAQQRRLKSEREQAVASQQQANELQQARLRTSRVLREIARNMDVHKRPRDIEGARVDATSGLVYDRRGTAYRREGGLLYEAQPTMVQTGLPGQVGQMRPRDLETLDFDQGYREILAEQQRNILVNKSLQERLHIERMRVVEQDKARAALEARAASQKLARELQAGTAQQLSGNVVRDSGGAFWQVGREGATPLDPRGAHIRTVIDKHEKDIARQREVEASAARRRAQAELRESRGQGPRRPGVQGVFDRAFGPGGGGTGQRGFRMDDILTSAMSFGRYVVSAGAFAAIFSIMRSIRESTVDYADSVTDLNVAMSGSGTASRGFLNTLGETSRLLGENPARALDAASRGIRAFGAGVEDAAGRERIGEQFSMAVAALGVIADKPLDSATGDIIAIANNFDIATDRLWRINDAVAAAKQEIGGAPAEIAQGLSSVGSAAEAAGFSLEETANMISLVQSRTDQSGRAVATRLGRIFAIMGGSGGRRAITNLNRQLGPDQQINVNESLAVQLRQLGAVYNDLTTAQQQQLRSALGGTANTRELIPLLQEQALLQEALAASYERSGQGMDEFLRKSRDLRGIVTKMKGDAQNIIVQLAEAGVFDAFVEGVRLIEPFLNSILQVLQVYNAMPGVMRRSLVILLQLVAAQKLYAFYLNARLRGSGMQVGAMAGGLSTVMGRRAMRSRMQQPGIAAGAQQYGIPMMAAPLVLSGHGYGRAMSTGGFGWNRRVSWGNLNPTEALAGGHGFARTRGFAGRVRADYQTRRNMALMNRGLNQMGMATGRATPRLLHFAAAVGTVGAASARATLGVNRLWMGFRGFLNSIDPMVLAIGGIIAVVHAWNASMRVAEHTAEMQAVVGTRVDRTDLRGDIQAREQLVEEWDQAGRGIFGALADFMAGGTGARTAEDLQAEADRIRKAAQGIDEGRADAARQRDISAVAAAIDVTTEGGIQAGLETLSQSGRSAATQVAALNEAMAALQSRSADLRASILTMGQQLEFRMLAWNEIASGFTTRAQLAERQNYLFDTRVFQDQTMPSWLPNWMQRHSDTILRPFSGGFLGDFLRGRMRGGEHRRESRAFRQIQDLDDVQQEAIQTVIDEFVTGSGGNLDHEAREELVQLILRQLGEFVDMGEAGSDVATTMEKEIRAAINNLYGDISEIENVSAIWDDFLRAAIELSGRFAQQAGLAARLTGRGGAAGMAEARTKLEYLQERVDQAYGDDDVTDEQMEQLLLERDQARVDLINAEISEMDQILALRQSRLASTDVEGRLQLQLATLRRQLALVGQDIEQRRRLQAQINDVNQQIAQAEVQRINAQQRAGVDSRDEVRRAHAEAWAAVRILRQIIDSGDRTSQAYWDAWDSYNQAMLNYANVQVERVNAFAQARLDPRDALGRAEEAARALRRELGVALPGTTGYANLVTQIREADLNVLRERVAIANARQRAGIDPQSGLQNARANLDAARRELGLMRRGTSEYYDALRTVNEAMIALADAQNEAMSVRRQLAIDLTDPVATARESLRTIQDRIRSAQSRGAPSDVVDQLRVEEKNQQAQVEAALFQQRLSDVQVAEQLGRISHAAYIRYLEGESARLGAIADRTRQQQDQLNQIDLLLKQAMEQMAGQWNIGDIRLPTPYEVRRAIEAEAAGLTLAESFRETQAISASRVTNDYRTANIQVYGASIEAVEQLLAEYFGPSTVSRSSTGVVEGGRI